MSSGTVADTSNWFRLQHLVGYSYVCLRRLFIHRYQQFFNQIWDDSAILGNRFYNQNIRPYPQDFNFYPVQITSIRNGNSEDWDLTTLTALLLNIHRPKYLKSKEIQVLNKEDKLLKDLRNIRNELAHHATRRITDTDFNSSWQQLKSILIYFGEDDTELDKLKDDIEFKSLKEIVDCESVKEMEDLNALGNQSFKDKNYIDAMKYFTKATTLPNVLSRDRALLYSNLSRTRLALCEQMQENDSTSNRLATAQDERYRASKDAKQARNLWPTWWKAHYRLGNAYVSMNEHEKAINSFERALALDPLNSEVKTALDSSRFKHSQQQRHEHLDPRLKPQTMGENLKEMEERFEIDPAEVRRGHLFAEMNDPTLANVNKGHQYFHGDPDMGIKQDYDQAATYFAEAARQGSAEGMYNLALMYDRGLGVKKDHSLATQFFEKVASQAPQLPKTNRPNNGVAEAQHELGLRYYNGIDVTKNLATAAYWYKRAAENGCEHAANNLAIMYREGSGVEQNSMEAEQWFQFAAKKGDPNAMLTLSRLSLEAINFEMARLWYQRACDAGHVLALIGREEFLAVTDQRQTPVTQLPPSLLHVFNEFKKVSDLGHIRPVPSKSSTFIYNYEQLQDYASKGSVTARQLCNALEHYYTALQIIMKQGNTDENRFIHELAEAYRTEHQAVQIVSLELYKKFETLIKTSLKNKPNDVDAKICYVYLHTDELEQNVKLLNEWKLKNPQYVHFYIVSADINCFLKNYNDALLNCNTGLKLDPTNYELLYTKAVALRLLKNTDQSDIIAAYQKFLDIAPTDHRKVPESYYAMAQCYLPREKSTECGATSKIISDEVYGTYEQGLAAEKLQLPCYIPYQSGSKTALETLLKFVNLCETGGIQPDHIQRPFIRQESTHLLDPHRIELFREHRRFLADIQVVIDNNSHVRFTSTTPPRTRQKKPKKLTGLKPITLREMNPTKNHIYDGYVLSLTIIEQTLSFEPSILLLVEDGNLYIERLFIYGFDKADGQRLIEDVFIIGNKMEILNPSIKIGTTDLKPSVRVDDFRSIIMQDDADKVFKMCRCCGDANATKGCDRCKNARYCSRECQIIDWTKYDHKLICKKAT